MDVAPAMDIGFISTPQGQGGSYYSGAPSSPTKLTELYCGFDELLIAAGENYRSSLATIPFSWEVKPGVPKTPTHLSQDEFSFDVTGDFANVSVPAEDLFHRGVIKTVDPPPYFQERTKERERGRERGFSSSPLPSSRSRRTRSLSPLGVSNYQGRQQTMSSRTKPQSTPACSAEIGSKRWSFKDLFLFRSASDGRAMDKYRLKNYFTINRKNDQDLTKDSCESMSKRRGRVLAHELHYNLNRANSNDMKKKTYLPYKHGILGGLSFSP